jgi:hypothetical protein
MAFKRSAVCDHKEFAIVVVAVISLGKKIPESNFLQKSQEQPHPSIAGSVIDRSQILALDGFRNSLILIMPKKSAFESLHDHHCKHQTTSMKIKMDRILQEIVEQAYEEARLGRIGGFPDRDLVFIEILANLESDGDAMRYVDSQGRIAWKATPDLRDYLNDLKLDAEADLADDEA